VKSFLVSAIALLLTLAILPLGPILLFTMDGKDCAVTPWCEDGPLPGWFGYIAFGLWLAAIIAIAVGHYFLKERMRNVQ
jgi:hypothetical protein